MEKNWYAWVVKRNRLDNVFSYIKNSVPEIDKYFYPKIKKEYKNKTGSSRVRDLPMYEGYLFLRYSNPIEVYQKLNICPFITTFAGSVTDQEIRMMEEAQGKLLTEIKASRFHKGDVVILLEGPFKGFEARVIAVNSSQIKVTIDAKILGKQGVDLFFTEEKIEHKPSLEGASVQDI